MTEKPRTAMITGASTGIGAATALAFAQAGFDLSIGARRADRLEPVAESARAFGVRVHSGRLDVAVSDSINQFFDDSESAVGTADIVVNNAGASEPALLHEYNIEAVQSEAAINFVGPILVTRRALQTLLRERSGGDIVFMSSDSVHRPRPNQTLYGAAKAGIENFASGLALELEGTDIRVSKIRIGPTATEFGSEWDFSDFKRVLARWRQVGLRDARLAGQLLPAEEVALATLDVVTKPRNVWIDTVEIQPAAKKPESSDNEEA